MASLNYLSLWDDVLNGVFNLSTATLKGMLVADTYTPNATTDLKRSNVTGEISGTGYTAGGFTVTQTITKNTANNRMEVAFASTPLANASITARALVVYNARGGVATADELVTYLDFGANITATNGTFTINYNTPLYLNN